MSAYMDEKDSMICWTSRDCVSMPENRNVINTSIYKYKYDIYALISLEIAYDFGQVKT